MKKIILIALFNASLFATDFIPIGKGSFVTSEYKEVSPKGKYIIIQLNNGLGKLLLMQGDRLIDSFPITGGAKGHETEYGEFSVRYKLKKHMSTLYPNANGINNMDDMLNINSDGTAIHKGSIQFKSHGCIHVDPSKSKKVYSYLKKDDKVFIISGDMLSFF